MHGYILLHFFFFPSQSVVYFQGKKMRKIVPCLEEFCLVYCFGQLSLASSETVIAGAKPIGPTV